LSWSLRKLIADKRVTKQELLDLNPELIRHTFLTFFNNLNTGKTFVLNINKIAMTRGNAILLAALGGAAVAALVASYLSTEQGKQLLSTATDTLKDVSGKAKEIAKNNLAEVLDETKNTVGKVVKDKLAQQLTR
jgi:hypothetical protein